MTENTAAPDTTIATEDDPAAAEVEQQPEIPAEVDTAEAADAEHQDDDPAKSARTEAARYRTKLRATERERDALVERLGVLQRENAEKVAAGYLQAGDDLWRDGADVSAVLDESGNVDSVKVRELAAAVAAAHPHYAAKKSAGVSLRRGTLASGATGIDSPSRASWSDVLKGD